MQQKAKIYEDERDDQLSRALPGRDEDDNDDDDDSFMDGTGNDVYIVCVHNNKCACRQVAPGQPCIQKLVVAVSQLTVSDRLADAVDNWDDMLSWERSTQHKCKQSKNMTMNRARSWDVVK